MPTLPLQSSLFTRAATILCLTAIAFTTINTAHAAKEGTRAPWVGKTTNGKPCQGGPPPSGPYDYLQPIKYAGALGLIHEHHFNSDVEQLKRGITTEPMGDIDFTLRTFPNHHRALLSATKFRLQNKKWPERSKGEPAECYLQRAIKYNPGDVVVHNMYAYLLHRMKQYAKAAEQYEIASKLAPKDMVIKYNMGLALTDVKRYQKARKVAKEVYGADFPLPALRNRLIDAGFWDPSKDDKVDEEALAASEEAAAEKGAGTETPEDGATSDQSKDVSATEETTELVAADATAVTDTSDSTDKANTAGTSDTTEAAAVLKKVAADEKVLDSSVEATVVDTVAQPKDSTEKSDKNEAPTTSPEANTAKEATSVAAQEG